MNACTVWWARVSRRWGAPAQAFVEFAIVILLFVGLCLAIIEGARLGLTSFTIGNAARDGARAGAFVGATNATVVVRVNQAAGAVVPNYATASDTNSCPANSVCVCRHLTPTATVNAACDSATAVQSGSVIDVTVTETFTFIPYGNSSSGIFTRANIPLTGYYRARIE